MLTIENMFPWIWNLNTFTEEIMFQKAGYFV